ncbi:MAG: alpha/beta hydrolase [Microscillaceae bacterium]|nr:alpha/beta hydrolase [Microscillaceae bacterium]
MMKFVGKLIGYGLLAIMGLLLVLSAIYFRTDIPAETLKARYANEASKFIEVQGMPVHYRDEGRGPVLVLLHGTAASLHTWDAWTEILKKKYRIIRLDLPGFGLTGPHPARKYQIQDYIAFLRIFTHKLGLNTFHLAGNSLGGHIAWEFALDYPKVVEKLILIDPAGYPLKSDPPFVFRLARTPVFNQLVRYITPRFFFRNNLEQVYHRDSLITEKLIDRYYYLARREGNRQAFIDRANTPALSRYTRLGDIIAPTLVMWGQEDAWIPAFLADKFAQAIPNAKVRLYEAAGHVPMEEIPELTVRDAEKFLDSNY